MITKLPVLVLGTVWLMALAGCGAGGSGGRSAEALSHTPAGAAPQSPQNVSGPVASDAPQKSPGDVSFLPKTPEGPRVQRTARVVLDVAAGRFDSTLNDVIAIVDQAGGYISGSHAQADDGQPMRSGQVTFQVPSAHFDDVLTQIRKRGTPRAISISGNDVSLQYVDLQARLTNAEAQRDAMLALLQQARSVNDTIQIQNQLDQVTGQIEELKGQISFLDHSTTYATVSVTIREITGGPKDEWGLQSAVNQAAHNFVNIIDFLVLALGALAPVLIGGLVLGWATWRGLMRYRRQQSTPATPSRAMPAE